MTGKMLEIFFYHVTLLPTPAMYKIKQDPPVFPPGFGYGWTDTPSMKMAYIYISRVL